jgi:hypothetical protein
MEIFQLPLLRSSSQLPMQNACQLTTWLTRSQAGGHFTPTSCLLFIGWLSTDNWTLSLTNQLLHITSLNWTADNPYSRTRLTLLITFRHESHRKQFPLLQSNNNSIVVCVSIAHVPSPDHYTATAIHATILKFILNFYGMHPVVCHTVYTTMILKKTK